MTFYTTVGSNIKKYRDIRNYTLQVLAEMVGVTKKTIQRYETGEIKIGMDRIESVAKALNVKVSQLMSGTKPYAEIKEAAGYYGPSELVMLPIVGRVSCGDGIVAYEEIEGYEPVAKEWARGGKHFFLRAKGDSMIGARIHEGDLLLIREQPEVENGEIAVVLIGEEAFLKRIFRNNGQLVLQSENPNYPPKFSPPEDVVIIGKLKKIIINL